jgi:thiamine-phosphate pyrophosphorylase
VSGFPRVTYITDTLQVSVEELLERATRSLDPVAIIVRDKQLALEARFTLAMEIRAWDAALALRPTVLFAIPAPGDLEPTLEWAPELGLDGVHFASAAWSKEAGKIARARFEWVSVACHSAAEVEERAREGANVLVLSPIFATPGKGIPLGLHALRDAAGRLDRGRWLIALGGVDRGNASACLQAGAHGVAAIRHELALVADA